MLGQVVLGKYKITRLLDEGGMSKIYLARHVSQALDVVVKVLKDELLAQNVPLNHFRREIHILSRFQHPNVVTYHDATPGDRQPLLVMEYLQGQDLHQVLACQRRLPSERVGRLLAPLCDVLQAAHDAGIVHRDLKPGNLMVLDVGTPRETLKLMDFGLAKMAFLLYLAPDEIVDFTLPAASGTPEYMSPEQVRGNEVDGRGDLYSVGVLLFEMLAGRLPFVHDAVEDVLDAHEAKEPPTFAALGMAGRIPPAIEAVVRSCLAKHPDDRPRSAAELAQRYEQALGKSIRGARPTTRMPAVGHGASPTKDPQGIRNGSEGPAVRHRFEESMPEAMAMLKIKGFIHDLGGEIVESVPGLIRVRLADPRPQQTRSGFFRWVTGGGQATATRAATELELHMERAGAGGSNRLAITLVLRPGSGPLTPELRERGDRIGRDLRAYLMGR